MPVRQTRPIQKNRRGSRRFPTRHVRSTGSCGIYENPRRLNEEELKRLTKAQLVTLARHEELPQRSKMNKAQLARTLRRHFRRAAR